MVKKSKITIVIACYNVEKYIAECIQSIQKQTYPHFEVLLVDDGSTDQTATIIQEEIKEDKRFHYYYKENGGVSSARNYGLDRAKGEYISFIDSDDYLEDTYLENLYQEIQEKNVDFTICSIKRIYPNKVTYHHMTKEDVYLAKFPAMWNKLCKLSLLKDNKIRFPENIWYEDLLVGAEVFISAKSFSIVDEFLHNYRQQEGSLVRRADDRIFDIYQIMEEIKSFAKKKRIYQKYRQNIEFMNLYHILIGTTYRASFHQHFSKEMIQEICEHVEKEYPNWYQNRYISTLPISYRTYLYIIHKKYYTLLKFLLKHLAKYLYL